MCGRGAARPAKHAGLPACSGKFGRETSMLVLASGQGTAGPEVGGGGRKRRAKKRAKGGSLQLSRERARIRNGNPIAAARMCQKTVK